MSLSRLWLLNKETHKCKTIILHYDLVNKLQLLDIFVTKFPETIINCSLLSKVYVAFILTYSYRSALWKYLLLNTRFFLFQNSLDLSLLSVTCHLSW